MGKRKNDVLDGLTYSDAKMHAKILRPALMENGKVAEWDDEVLETTTRVTDNVKQAIEAARMEHAVQPGDCIIITIDIDSTGVI